jgi:hypothetical protein
MFGQRMVERDRFPELKQCSSASFAMLRNTIKQGLEQGMFQPLPLDMLTTCAWSLVHGMSMLCIDGLVAYDPANTAQYKNLDFLAQSVTHLLANGLLHPDYKRTLL